MRLLRGTGFMLSLMLLRRIDFGYLCSALLVAVAVSMPAASPAAMFHWDGGDATNGNFAQANNWSPNGAPPNSDQTELSFGSVALVSPFRTTANNTVAGFKINNITFSSAFPNSFLLQGSQIELSKHGATSSRGLVNELPSIIQLSALSQAITAPLKLGENLTLTGNGTGLVTISGVISEGKSITKAGTSTYQLNGSNTYTGGTTINAGTLIAGHANALGTSGTITVNNTGTLAINSAITFTRAATFNSGSTLAGKGTYTPGAAGSTFTVANGVDIAPGIGDVGTLAIGRNTTFASGSELRVDVSGATADRLNVTGNLGLDAGSIATFNVGSAPTLGRYGILDYTGTRTGTFTTTNNVPADYKIEYNDPNTIINLRHRATIGTISVTPVNPMIITGGSTPVNFTVQNSAPTDSFDLVFTAAAGINTTGSASGTVAANGTGGPSSNTLAFNGTTVGLNQPGSITLTDAEASNSPQNGVYSVSVLDHADGSFDTPADPDQNTLVLVFNVMTGQSSMQSYSLSNLPGTRAGLVFSNVVESGDDDNVAGTGFYQNNITSFGTLAAGGTTSFFDVFFDATNLTSGVYQTTYTLNLSDQALPGAAAQALTINITGNVVPEPDPALLLSLGLVGLAVAGRRRNSEEKS